MEKICWGVPKVQYMTITIIWQCKTSNKSHSSCVLVLSCVCFLCILVCPTSLVSCVIVPIVPTYVSYCLSSFVYLGPVISFTFVKFSGCVTACLTHRVSVLVFDASGPFTLQHIFCFVHFFSHFCSSCCFFCFFLKKARFQFTFLFVCIWVLPSVLHTWHSELHENDDNTLRLQMEETSFLSSWEKLRNIFCGCFLNLTVTLVLPHYPIQSLHYFSFCCI